jgi:hypothetical protein
LKFHFLKQLPANDAATASFWIVADTLGQIPIELTAVSSIAADAVSIPLLVKVCDYCMCNVWHLLVDQLSAN